MVCKFRIQDRCFNRDKLNKVYNKRVPNKVLDEGMELHSTSCMTCNNIQIKKESSNESN